MRRIFIDIFAIVTIICDSFQSINFSGIIERCSPRREIPYGGFEPFPHYDLPPQHKPYNQVNDTI